MYVPEIYRAPDPSWIQHLIRRNPLAMLVTNGPSAPQVTHVPVIFCDPEHPGPAADLAGMVLAGHMNRANPHWSGLAGGGPAVLIFCGPHGYVSPVIYQHTPAAPTWDFATVHLHGALTPLAGEEATLAVILATVRSFEAEFGRDWDMTASLPYFQKILRGVGAFQFAVERVDAMFKLSQEQEHLTRLRITAEFAASGTGLYQQLAALMAQLPDMS